MSYYTSLSGLKAAQTDLGVISNNVANVGTIGFKKSNTEFGDIISSAPLQTSTTAGQGTRLRGIAQQFTQGGFENSDRALDLAISGQGFFATRTGLTNGTLTYTRNGAFTVNKDRYVVDESGAFLQILPTDNEGTVTAAGIEATRNLQLPLTSGVSRATTTLQMSVTLPAEADLPEQRSVYSASNPYQFDRFDANSYNHSSATTVYDVNGNPLPATIYYTRQTTPTAADPSSTWEARLFVGDVEVSSDAGQTVPRGGSARPHSRFRHRDPPGLLALHAQAVHPGRLRGGAARQHLGGLQRPCRRDLLERHQPGGRQDRARQLHQSGGPAPAWRRQVERHRQFGRAAGRRRRREWLWHHPVGRARAGQCGHNRGAGRADRGAAEFLGQRQGDRDRQHDDPDHRQPADITIHGAPRALTLSLSKGA
jgi:flagellar hook-basal body protein